jgi:predicted nuclease of predicted toxin-antitoxin system
MMPKRILIDENLPKRLKNEFSGHTVSTVPEMGWSSKKNGELLALMSGQFEVFVTADQNLMYQQNLTEISFAIVILAALKNTLEYRRPLIPQALEQLEDLQPGDIVIISSSDE